MIAEKGGLLLDKKADLALHPAHEGIFLDELKFACADKLVQFLSVALLIAKLVVATAHRCHEEAIWLECRVNVVHSGGGNVPFEEDTGCCHDIEFFFQFFRELISPTAHPDLVGS